MPDLRFLSPVPLASEPAGPLWRRLRTALAVLLALAGTLPDASQAARRTISIGADEMTRRVAEQFPRRHCLMMIACVTLSDPVVELKPGDDRVHLRTVVRPELGGQLLEAGSLAVAGMPRYEPTEGALYLDRAEVTQAHFPDLSPSRQRPVTELASGLLAEALRTAPIHRLDERDAEQALARLVLRAVRVENGKLVVVIGDDD